MLKSANKRRGTNKKLYPPQQEPSQSTKSTTEEGPKFKNNLAQSQRLQRKACLSPWMDCSSTSKALLFLFFQMVQNKHRGAASHTVFHLLPTKESCHPKSVSPTKEESTQGTPNRESKRFYNTLIS